MNSYRPPYHEFLTNLERWEIAIMTALSVGKEGWNQWTSVASTVPSKDNRIPCVNVRMWRIAISGACVPYLTSHASISLRDASSWRKLWWGTQGCCSFSSFSSVANPKESQKIKCVFIQRHPRRCKRHHLCHNLTSEHQGSCKPLGNRHKKIFKPFTASSEGRFDDLNETSDET